MPTGRRATPPAAPGPCGRVAPAPGRPSPPRRRPPLRPPSPPTTVSVGPTARRRRKTGAVRSCLQALTMQPGDEVGRSQFAHPGFVVGGQFGVEETLPLPARPPVEE